MGEDQQSQIDMFATRLREEIANKVYGDPGVGAIPTTSELAKTWGISRNTVYQILQIVQGQGYIREKGKRLVVFYPVLALAGIVENFERYLKDLGHEVEIINAIEPHLTLFSKREAEMFQEQEGLPTVHRMRIQGIVGTRLRIAENWYPATLAADYVERMRSDERMNVIGTIKQDHGKWITHTENELITRLPLPHEAKMLEINRNVPIFEVRRICTSKDGTPIMWNNILYNGPYFRFKYGQEETHWN
jgi:DNA-binding GntR family transcriptional regulator